MSAERIAFLERLCARLTQGKLDLESELRTRMVVMDDCRREFARMRDQRDTARAAADAAQEAWKRDQKNLLELQTENRAKTVRIDQLLAARDADRVTFGVFNPGVTTPARWRDARKEGFDAGVAWQRQQHEKKFMARAVEVGDLREENDQLKEDLREVSQLRADIEHEREAFRQLSKVVQVLRSQAPFQMYSAMQKEIAEWRKRAEIAERANEIVKPILEAARKAVQSSEAYRRLADTVRALEDSLR